MADTKSGVTLIELMIVVIVIGILATFAIPNFIKVPEITKAREAVVSLEQIRNGEIIYRTEENTYWASSGAGDTAEINEINDKLGLFLDARTNRNWDYAVGLATTQAFTATATRISGRNDDETITIDEEGSIDASGWSP